MNPVKIALEQNPIIAAVREPARWNEAITSPAKVLFLLCGDIMTVRDMVTAAKNNGKYPFVHLELLGGIGRDASAIEFIAKEVAPTGIISTRTAQIRSAKERGLVTVQRFFLLDSQSLDTAVETARVSRPDFVELMPGIMPELISRFSGKVTSGIIAGGLIETKEQVMEALSAGADNVSTSKELLWEL